MRVKMELRSHDPKLYKRLAMMVFSKPERIMSWTWYFSSRVIVAVLLILLLKIAYFYFFIVAIVPVSRIDLISSEISKSSL